MKKLLCMLGFHEWTKWTQCQATYSSFLFKREYETIVQWRDCKCCGKRVVKEL